MSNPTFLQLEISLKGVKPPIWRRVIVPNSLTLYELHQVLIAAMGWDDHHMHQFEMNGQYYGDPTDDHFGDDDTEEETQYQVSAFLRKEKDKINYEYDFSDTWEHQILLEKIVPTAKQHPVCIKGKRACPPEDVGGIWGYEEFLEIIADKKHPDYADTLDWAGGNFDPDHFDLKAANAALAALPFFKA